MAKGTFRIRARVWAKRVLPEPVGPDQQDVALLQLHILAAAEEDALIVVVDGHRERHLGLVLTDDILIQDGTDVLGRGDIPLHFRHGVSDRQSPGPRQ